jgi:4-hydroxythreonine-4-phosphate dehydrogenase
MSKPVIAITMGDAAGIGPELIVKVLAHGNAYQVCKPLVIGAPKVIEDIAGTVGAGIQIRAIQEPTQARFESPYIDVLCPEDVYIDNVSFGKLEPAMGRAAALCLGKAFELAMESHVQGVVSAPLNKEAFHLAGYEYADELEYLAKFTGSQNTFMFGVANSVWTVMVTEHIAFRRIVEFVKKDRILRYIHQIQDVLKQVGIPKPRIAVAALNVHAGEGGIFGREEIDEIEPAIQQAREQGIHVQGPVPADMVFVRALEGDFDGIVYMYHDQGNIARKLQPKEKGCTLFVGLPVPCGTTAHGTAFDKAGLGIADPGSLAAALEYTTRLASQLPGENKRS